MDKIDMLKLLLRPIKRVAILACCSAYDFYRYLVYSALIKTKDGLLYKIVKTYHSLEKNLSFRNRNRTSGQAAAKRLVGLYGKSYFKKDTCMYTHLQSKVGLKVLKDYINASDANERLKEDACNVFLNHAEIFDCELAAGTLMLNDVCSPGGTKLTDPESFFFSRFSVRSFNDEKVSDEVIKRALYMATKTPSVCNRQEWIVYQIKNKEKILKALELQNGNRGFSENINNLLVIAVDLKAFEDGHERFQGWVDGGLYAMTLVYALHALNVSSCLLNLCNFPTKDIKLRKLLGAKSEHSFIVMIAVGYSDADIKVCASSRTSAEDYHIIV